MLRVVLVGPSDIEYHFFKLLKISKKKFYKEIEKIAKVLYEIDAKIVLLPDKGISLEIAKKFKEFGGETAYATIPLKDRDFGIEHLKSYLNINVKNKKLFNNIINTENWYKQNLIYCLCGDIVLFLGISLGSLGELAYGLYLYKIIQKHKVKIKNRRLYQKIKSGKVIPFSIIVYRPFLKERLNYEIERYISRIGAKLYYVNSSVEIKRIIKNLLSS